MPPSSGNLLQEFAVHGDQQAFSQLVQQNIDLVFSAALRRVRDRQLAEDVTQAVFVILARRAGKLRSNIPLSGWLLTCVRYAATNAIRVRKRRLRHETAASRAITASGGGACSSDPTEVLVWQEIAAELDDAVLNLPALDRRIVLMKYFENRGNDEIASDLQLSQGAVRTRLCRALEKLRTRLDRRGASVALLDATALSVLLSNQIIRLATPGLSQAACAAAMGTATTLGSTFTIAKGAMTMMSWTKAKIAAAIIATAMIATTGGVIGSNLASAQDQPAAGQLTLQPSVDASIQSQMEKLMDALKANDRTAFVANASPEMKAAMTPQVLNSVHDQLKPHLDAGYTPTYFGELKKDVFKVYVWKISFKDGSDDHLAQMTLLNGKLAGFLIQ